MGKKKTEEQKATAAAKRADNKAKTKTGKAKASPRKRKGAREEQIPVQCRATVHKDLQGEPGVLTLDYAPNESSPHTATFDPADEEIENAIIAIYGFVRSDKTIAIQSEGPKWRFGVLTVSLDDEDDDEGEHNEDNGFAQGLREDGKDE